MLVEEKLQAVNEDENPLAKINREIYNLKKKKRLREKTASHVDFVTQNVIALTETGMLAQKTDRPTEDDKIEQAKAIREHQTHEKLIKDMANLRKWDFIRNEREKYETYVNIRERNRAIRTNWVRHVKAIQVLTFLAQVY